MGNNKKKRSKPKPLNISCTASDCENGLHCFKQTRKMTADEKGTCRECGVDLVNWNRVHKKNIRDTKYTFEALRNELIRHHFWHKEIDIRAINHARRKGRQGIKVAIRHRIAKSVGQPANAFDGRQTQFEGNSIYYAQHALAACCRTCMEYWHGIPIDQELTDQQVDYFSDMAMMYIDERLPTLTEHGEKVPAIRNTNKYLEEK